MDPKEQAGQPPAEGGQGEGTQSGKASEQTFEVQVGGETMKVPLTELQNGYLRQADYTKKTQAISAREKEMDRLIEEKATQLYLDALAQGKSESEAQREAGKAEGEVRGDVAPEIEKKVSSLEARLQAAEQARQIEEGNKQLESLLADAKKKYENMDAQKVMIRFYNEAKETDDIPALFDKFAKESHDEFLKLRQRIIDEYVAEKTRGPRFGPGELGHSAGAAGADKGVPPAKTFEEARERAEARLRNS